MPTTTAEGGGYVVTCECQWLRWFAAEKDAAQGRAEHVKKCKTHKAGGDE